jgi:hypothetical protein
MNQFQEKIFFGVTTLASSSFSLLGAMLTTGETRWLYVTLASSIMMSGFIALMFKKPSESIQLVIGRCGFAILAGVLATRPIVHQMGLSEIVNADVISLAGVSAATCIAAFFVGVQILRAVERAAPSLVDKWFKRFTE